jgi:hypothetical protein
MSAPAARTASRAGLGRKVTVEPLVDVRGLESGQSLQQPGRLVIEIDPVTVILADESFGDHVVKLRNCRPEELVDVEEPGELSHPVGCHSFGPG